MTSTLITLLGLGALLSPALRTPTRRAARVAPPLLQELEPEWLDALLDTSKGAATSAAGTSKRRKRTDAEPRAPRPKPAKIAKQRCACYGCGADLQTAAPSVAGYVEPDRYEEKAVHRQLKLLLCTRCRSLAQGEILPAVAEGRMLRATEPASDGVGVTTPEQLRAELASIRDLKCLVVLLVDLTDVTGSFLPRVRDLVAGNPIVLIGTKVDLLPKGTIASEVEGWLSERLSPLLNVVSVHLVSAKTGEGMSTAVRSILIERKGRDLFVLGAANVGKSLFVGALLEEAFGQKAKRLPLSSPTPGTTLRMIGVDCFDGASMLFDTPGVHLAHRLSAQLLPEELKAILPRGRVKPYTPTAYAAGSTFFWGGLVRVDVLEAPPALRLSFVAAFNLRVTHCESTADADALYVAEAGRSLTPPLDVASATELGGLVLSREIELELTEMQQVADVCISGLGWVSVGALASLVDKGSPMRVRLAVWVPKGVTVSVRPPMPIGGLPNHVDWAPDETVISAADRWMD